MHSNAPCAPAEASKVPSAARWVRTAAPAIPSGAPCVSPDGPKAPPKSSHAPTNRPCVYTVAQHARTRASAVRPEPANGASRLRQVPHRRLQVPSRRPDLGVIYTGTPTWPPGEISGERTRMKAQVFGLRIAGTIFLLIALAHLVRLFAGVGVVNRRLAASALHEPRRRRDHGCARSLVVETLSPAPRNAESRGTGVTAYGARAGAIARRWRHILRRRSAGAGITVSTDSATRSPYGINPPSAAFGNRARA